MTDTIETMPRVALVTGGSGGIGRVVAGALLSAAAMNSRQIRAGIPPPATPGRGLLSSLPIHTPATRSPAKPMNKASRLSCEVPVLP